MESYCCKRQGPTSLNEHNHSIVKLNCQTVCCLPPLLPTSEQSEIPGTGKLCSALEHCTQLNVKLQFLHLKHHQWSKITRVLLLLLFGWIFLILKSTFHFSLSYCPGFEIEDPMKAGITIVLTRCTRSHLARSEVLCDRHCPYERQVKGAKSI